MHNHILSTIAPYVSHVVPHPATTPEQKADWQRWLAAWVEPTLCPRCGGALKRRKGRRGPFVGYGHYPDCRYTRDALRLPTGAVEVCPICAGYISSTENTSPFEYPYTYHRCQKCGTFPGSRFTTKEEKVQVKIDKAAKAEKERIAKSRKAAKGKKLQREMIPQLPVEGFDYKEWGELWVID